MKKLTFGEVLVSIAVFVFLVLVFVGSSDLRGFPFVAALPQWLSWLVPIARNFLFLVEIIIPVTIFMIAIVVGLVLLIRLFFNLDEIQLKSKESKIKKQMKKTRIKQNRTKKRPLSKDPNRPDEGIPNH